MLDKSCVYVGEAVESDLQALHVETFTVNMLNVLETAIEHEETGFLAFSQDGLSVNEVIMTSVGWLPMIPCSSTCGHCGKNNAT